MTKYALILAALASSAAAFAPASALNTKTGLNAFANGMVGSDGPEPMPFRPGPDKSAKDFDPAGFTTVRWPCVTMKMSLKCLNLTCVLLFSCL